MTKSKKRKVYVLLISVFCIIAFLPYIFISVTLNVTFGKYIVRENSLDNIVQEQKETEYVWVGKEIKVKNAGKLSKDRLIIVTNGYYDHRIDDKMRAAYKVNDDWDFMIVGFTDECQGLNQVAYELMEFIDSNLIESYDEIIVAGISKGGCISIKMMQMPTSYEISFININSPYLGSIMACPELVNTVIYEEDRLLNDAVWGIYDYAYSYSVADDDVGIYSEFLSNLDYSVVEGHNFVNVTSTLNAVTFMKDLTDLNKDGVICHFSDSILGIQGDGIVSLESQMYITQKADVKNIHVSSSHGTFNDYILQKALKALKEE